MAHVLANIAFSPYVGLVSRQRQALENRPWLSERLQPLPRPVRRWVTEIVSALKNKLRTVPNRMRTFTVVDTLGTLKACLALFPFVFAPGYVAGWALDLFEFRKRRPILRLILSLPLSIGICPMLSYLLARFLEPSLWAFYIGLFAACVLLLALEILRAKVRSVPKYTLSKY